MNKKDMSKVTEDALKARAIISFTKSVMCINCDRIITSTPDNACPICSSKEVYPTLPGHKIKAASHVPDVRRVS